MISKESKSIKLSYKIIIVLWLYVKTLNISLDTCDSVVKLDSYLTVIKCHNVLLHNRIRAPKAFLSCNHKIMCLMNMIFLPYFFTINHGTICIITVHKFCPDEISFIAIGSIILEHICSRVLPNITH